MLTSLSIENFAVVKQVNVNFASGLSVITGETGAGKSIGIDGLSLCLGARADASSVRQGCNKAQVQATFDINNVPLAQQWLTTHELDNDDNPQECHIRRVISAEGRSKAFINGTAVNLNQLRSLGQYLIAIHGQHAHHQLLDAQQQLDLVDLYAQHQDLLDNTAKAYDNYQAATSAFNKAKRELSERKDRQQLLTYQVKELDDFNLQEGEFEELEVEYKRLSNAQTLLETAQLSFYRISEDEHANALMLVNKSIQELDDLLAVDNTLVSVVQCLKEAQINLDEAASQLNDYCSDLDIDPMRIQQVDVRYNQAQQLAKKHNLMPEQLYQHHCALKAELDGLKDGANSIENLAEEVSITTTAYLAFAQQLHHSRTEAGNALAQQIVESVANMNMPHTQLTFELNYLESSPFTAQGLDQINLMVTTNPGQPMGPIGEIVSGGELSRIGLAIQVITSHLNAIPTLIFDEVDTGISGPTAAIVGNLLRQLGDQNQVICVTHLPQVAAQGHQQLFVNKLTDGQSTETSIRTLNDEARVRELARLLAGDEITESALANATELLSKVS